MITSQDHLETYKKAVRLKYELEKKGDYSSFLITPSRARLRDLCKELFKDNSNVDDLKSFRLFFGFECNLEGLNKLRGETDKFRPIENFLKGETDIAAIEGINIAAVLVDYKPRPFKKYVKQQSDLNTNDDVLTEEEGSKKEEIGVFVAVDPINEEKSPEKEKKRRGFFFWLERNKLATLFLIIAALLGGFSLSRYVFAEKQCMQWQNDRYVVVDCLDKTSNPLAIEIRPVKEELLNFSRVEVCDSTTFFKKNGDPLVWYCKVNGKPEFFNSLGDGYHPETRSTLRPVSNHIIEKYVGRCD